MDVSIYDIYLAGILGGELEYNYNFIDKIIHSNLFENSDYFIFKIIMFWVSKIALVFLGDPKECKSHKDNPLPSRKILFLPKLFHGPGHA